MDFTHVSVDHIHNSAEPQVRRGLKELKRWFISPAAAEDTLVSPESTGKKAMGQERAKRPDRQVVINVKRDGQSI